MERNFGKKLSENLKQTEMFTKKIMGHVQDQNQFRKKMPIAFQAGAYDSTIELEQLMKECFKPVSIPIDIKL